MCRCMVNETPTFDLLQTTVGKTLAVAIRDLGCPMLPADLLTAEQQTFFLQEMNGLPTDSSALNLKIASALRKGTVVRTGVTPMGQHLFTVRFPLTKRDVTLTLAYFRDEWGLHCIDAVQSRNRALNHMLLGGVIGCVVTGVLAFVIWGLNGDDLIQEAQQQGYVVMTQEKYNEQIQTSEAIGAAKIEDTQNGQVATKADDKQDGQTSSDSTASTDQDQGEQTQDEGAEVSFTLEQGMTTWDLTSFLLQEGLIQDQGAFSQELTARGIDTRLQPKTYTFHKGMTEEEVLSALEN